MAVWFIFWAAFANVVKSFVDNIFMPPIGRLMGKLDFSQMFIPLDGNKYATLSELEKAWAPAIKYGLFINDAISFILLGFIIFILIRAITRLQKREEEVKETTPPIEVKLLTEIRDALKK